MRRRVQSDAVSLRLAGGTSGPWDGGELAELFLMALFCGCFILPSRWLIVADGLYCPVLFPADRGVAQLSTERLS